jgi:hypothetical protein
MHMRISASKLFKIMFFTGMVIPTVACGPKLMIPTQSVNEAKPESALITFVRARSYAGKSVFHIWDSMDYVGTIIGGQYIQKEVAPGEHMFIVHAQNWAYIKADLEAGKKYFIVLNTAPGFTHAAAIPVPITKAQTKYGQSDIDNWMTTLTPMIPNPQSAPAWVAERKPQVEKAVAKGQAPDARFQELGSGDYWN